MKTLEEHQFRPEIELQSIARGVFSANEFTCRASNYQTNPNPPGYLAREDDRATMEKLWIVRTLLNAPDFFLCFFADGGFGSFSTCRHG
jgi:hypothetical protein